MLLIPWWVETTGAATHPQRPGQPPTPENFQTQNIPSTNFKLSQDTSISIHTYC